MSKVFVSYRHADPDQGLAGQIVDALKADRHDVFWDKGVKPGERWAEQIDRHLEQAEFVVVLISKHSVVSDMVREEVSRASAIAKEPNSRLVILPVRVAYAGRLPYGFGAHLNPVQYLRWNSPADTPELMLELQRAVAGNAGAAASSGAPSPGVADSGTDTILAATHQGKIPLPQAEFLFESGTIRPESPFYVERRDDALVLRRVVARGTTVIIKGVRQIGKSSLLARAARAVQQAGAIPIGVDFQVLDRSHLQSLETLLRFLASEIASATASTAKLDAFWSVDAGPKLSASRFLEQAVLPAARAQVVLLLDEVDRVFDHADYRDDFFAAIRVWHNQRAQPGSPWAKLNLVIVHSTEPLLYLTDINQSPFNVGERIHLDDFSGAEVADLNRRYGSPLAENEIAGFQSYLGGHPYLVRLALYQLQQNDWTLGDLKAQAPDARGPFGDHLKRFVLLLNRDRATKAAFEKVLAGKRLASEQQFLRLLAAGLITGPDRDHATPRCQLYAEYFPRHL